MMWNQISQVNDQCFWIYFHTMDCSIQDIPLPNQARLSIKHSDALRWNHHICSLMVSHSAVSYCSHCPQSSASVQFYSIMLYSGGNSPLSKTQVNTEQRHLSNWTCISFIFVQITLKASKYWTISIIVYLTFRNNKQTYKNWFHGVV